VSEPGHYLREIRLETHHFSMCEWGRLIVVTEAARPVFHAVEQRQTHGYGKLPPDQWGVVVVSDTGPFECEYVGGQYLPPSVTHEHSLVAVKSRRGMALAHPEYQKYLGSFVCESGHRWFVFRALSASVAARPSPGSTQSSTGARASDSSHADGSTKSPPAEQSPSGSKTRSPSAQQSPRGE
jgi:hypothetical protein